PDVRLFIECEDHGRNLMKQAQCSPAAPSRESFDIARRGALPFFRWRMRLRRVSVPPWTSRKFLLHPPKASQSPLQCRRGWSQPPCPRLLSRSCQKLQHHAKPSTEVPRPTIRQRRPRSFLSMMEVQRRKLPPVLHSFFRLPRSLAS